MVQVVIITMGSNGSSVHRITTGDRSEVQARIGHRGKFSFSVGPEILSFYRKTWPDGGIGHLQGRILPQQAPTREGLSVPTARDSVPSPRGLHAVTVRCHSFQLFKQHQQGTVGKQLSTLKKWLQGVLQIEIKWKRTYPCHEKGQKKQ